MMPYAVAEELGLLEDVVRKELQRITFWEGKVDLLMEVVEGIPFKLGDNIEITSPIHIFPSGYKEEDHDIMLDNGTLRKYNVIQ